MLKKPFNLKKSLLATSGLVVSGVLIASSKSGLVQKMPASGQDRIATNDTATASPSCAVGEVEKSPALFVSCGGFLP
jgi:hypothetical protein